MIKWMKKIFGGNEEFENEQKAQRMKTLEYNEKTRQKAIEYLGEKWVIHPENFVKKIRQKRTYHKRIKNMV